jgi:hypothetical protein
MNRWLAAAVVVGELAFAPKSVSADPRSFSVKVVSVASAQGPCIPEVENPFFFDWPYGEMNGQQQCSVRYLVGDAVRLFAADGTYTETTVANLPVGFTVLSAGVWIGGGRAGNCTTFAGGQCNDPMLPNSVNYPAGTTIQNIVGDLIGGDGFPLYIGPPASPFVLRILATDWATVTGTYDIGPFTLSVSPSRLDLSTGDVGRFVTTTATPPGSFTPTFTVGTSTNPNSSCVASLSFAGGGPSPVNSTVTAAPAGCSSIFDNVRANVGTTSSTNATKIVVPPQIMIKVVVGEAGGQPGDIDQQSLLAVGRNRFGDRDFGRPATWQAVLIPSQFYGANDPTTDGPAQELQNSAKVFTGEVGDIIGGSKCYWSPTNAQWANIEAAFISGTKTEPANAGIPDCWSGKPRQIVDKASVGLNVSGGANYNQAPAFVFLRQRTKNDPAVVQIP